ncbi:MAG: SBBP repeat-containing protein, partial [Nitrospirae bacterium]|nr:SBBP repeat-containing protein [Nitrospirota bacterium]
MRLFTKIVGIVAIILVMCHIMAVVSHSIAPPDINKSDHQTGMNTHEHEVLSKLPLYFIQNNGQLDKRVKFYEKGSGHSTFFAEDGVYLSLIRNEKKDILPLTPSSLAGEGRGGGAITSQLVKLSFLSANKNPEIIAADPQESKVNYFIGNDPAGWKTNIPTYSAVVFKEVYPGINIKFYGTDRQLEYDIIVKPGADPAKIKMAFEEVDGLRVLENGGMEIGLKEGKLFQKKPYIYQEIDGKRVEVAGSFRLIRPEHPDKGLSTYGFEVAGYDKRYPLVIDPILDYSTYLGGSAYDDGHGITLDIDGNAYVVGDTASTDFPTYAPFQVSNSGGDDVFVTKINPSGTAMVFSTYLGGSSDDDARDIAIDGSGNVYITGITSSNNFPVYLPLYSSNSGSSDAFVTKLNSTGNALVYSTYLGGSGQDTGRGIAVDSAGNAYVTGDTKSSTFPTTSGAYDTSYGGGGKEDSFVTKLNAAGSALVYSTYLGGSSEDIGRGIAVDSGGYAYIAGDTKSSTFPTTPGAYDTFHGGSSDVFVTKLNSVGNGLVYSTYLGGSGSDGSFVDRGRNIVIDSDGNAYITGDTASSDFPTTTGAYDTSYGGNGDAFVTKLNPDGNGLVYSTYLGGSGKDQSPSIAIDSAGNAYVTGQTDSTDFPVLSPPAQGTYAGGLWDAFVTSISPSGDSLVYSTYLGGSLEDQGLAIASDSAGRVCITGRTISTNFPIFPTVPPLIQGTFGGGVWDAFVTCIGAPTVTLSVSNAGTGSGTVTSSPGGINCGVDCSEAYTYGTVVTLTATPATGSAFAGWSGDADCLDGIVIVDSAKSCTATFNLQTYTLSVINAGTGSGTVTSSPGGINCGVDCDEAYSYGTSVTLTATPATGSLFAGWSGDADCSDGIVTVDSAKSCTATFNLQTYTLSVSKSGTGSGTVTSSPAGISCGSDCSEAYTYGTSVTLTATPATGSVFAGWSGDADCSDGVVTVDSAKSCTATFNTGTASADLSITKTDSPDPVPQVGDNVTYTITVTNNGPSTATGVTVTDTLDSLTYVSALPSQGICSGTTTVTCNLDTLAYGSIATITIVAGTNPPAGMIGNTASVTANETDPDTTNNSATETTNVGDVSKLINLSSRAVVQTGFNVVTGGFVLGGSSPKTLLIRGRGPSLSGAPYNYSGTLSNPMLQLWSITEGKYIAQNDDWQTTDSLCADSGYACGTPSDITATGKDPCQPNPNQTVAPPGCSNEAALLITLPPGRYTVTESGVNDGTGLGIFEIFDPDTSTMPKLNNLSTRAIVQTGFNVLTGGFIIGAGTGNKSVLIRGRGPSMSGAPYNYSGTLSNPMLQLWSIADGKYIAQNDDWQTTDTLCADSGYACGTPSDIIDTGKDPCQP